MSQRYRRDMYPYQQPSIPFTQAAPQSQYYHPAFEGMMAQMMQQTQERHDNVVSAIAQDRAARGMMPHVDSEYHNKMLSSFTEDLESIVGDYGGHYANAASRLIERIGKEAGNPYYNLARHHAEQAKIEQDFRLRHGHNTLMPQGSVMDKKITPESTIQDLTASLYEAPDYTNIGRQLMSNIQADLIDAGMSIESIQNVLHALKTGQTGGVSKEDINRVAKAMLEPFKTAAANREFDNRPGFEWVHDDESIVRFLANLGSSQIHDVEKYNYNVLSHGFGQTQTSTTTPPHADARRIFARDSEYDVSRSDKRESNDVLSTVQSLPSILQQASTLESVLGGAVLETIRDPETNVPVPPGWWETATDAEKARWREGEASWGDALRMIEARVASLPERFERVPLISYERVKTLFKNDRNANQVSREIHEIFGGRTGIRISIGKPKDGSFTDYKVGEDLETKKKQSDLLEILWEERDKYNLTKDEDGLITFDFSGTNKGIKDETERAKQNIMNSAVSEIRNLVRKELLSRTRRSGLTRSQQEAEKAYNKIQGYMEKYPMVEDLFEAKMIANRDLPIESRQTPDQILLESVQAMANTQMNREMRHSSEVDLGSTATKLDKETGTRQPDHTARNAENRAFNRGLEIAFGHARTDEVVEVIPANRRDREKPIKVQDFRTLIARSNISSARVIPLEATLVLQLEDNPNLYQIDINKANIFPKGHREQLTEIQKFIDNGRNFKEDTIILGNREYRYQVEYDEQRNVFEPIIIGRAMGSDGKLHMLEEFDLSSESEFLQDYGEFIFQSFIR